MAQTSFTFPRDWLTPEGRQGVPSPDVVEFLAQPAAASALAFATGVWDEGWGIEMTLTPPGEGVQQAVLTLQYAAPHTCDCEDAVRPHRQALLDMLKTVEGQLTANHDGLSALAFVRARITELAPKEEAAVVPAAA